MRCPSCGEVVAPDSDFCRHCGAALERDPREAPTTASDAGDDPAEPQPTEPQPAEPQPAADADRSSADDGALAGRFWINSIVGGAAGVALASVLAILFVPSYVLGIGGGAFLGGMLHSRGTGSGAKVGAVVGVLSTVPFLVLVGVVVLLGAGWLASTGVPLATVDAGMAGMDLATGLGVVGLFVSVAALVVNLLGGICGGALGGVVAGN